MKTNRHLLAGLVAAALVAPAWAAPTAISATLDPTRVALGDSAMLTVSFRGQQAAEPRLPIVDGLDITPAGESTSMQIINGAVSSSTSYQYDVTPRHAGSFTIPAISAGGATAQPIGFRVDPGNAGPSAQPGRSSGNLQPPSPNMPNEDRAVDAKDQPAFLRIAVPKQSLYVGEQVPAQVKAYFRAGSAASLEGLPLLGGNAFALGKLSDKPEQTEEMIGGEPYTVLTWDSALSGVKAGDYPLTLDLPVTVRVREKGRHRGRNPFKDFFGNNSPFGSMLDDSFFDDFGGGATEKSLTLHTDATAMHIQSPPATGRPVDFSGAVGDFNITADVSSASATSGDPLTLKIAISGQGNFDRVITAGLAKSAEWKTYKPGAKFDPADSAGISGTKTFEQTVIPTQAGAQQIPVLNFSYFDPTSGKYITKHTAPIALNVAAADPSKAAAPVPTAPTSTAVQPVANAPAAANVNASPIASLHPLIFRPWFILLNTAMLAALVLMTLARWIKLHRRLDPQRLAREAAERSVRASLARMERAVQESDSPKFFEAARHAVQERLAEHWHLPASEVTPAIVAQRLNGNGEPLRTLFKTADEAAYCGRRFTPEELRRWRDAVEQQLQHIADL